MVSTQMHVAPYVFALAESGAGGLQSVFLKEARSGRKLTILSTDSENLRWHGSDVVAADPQDEDLRELFLYWFGTGAWQWLHPAAHTAPHADEGALAAMLVEETGEEFGTLAHLLEVCSILAPTRGIHARFNARFDRAIGRMTGDVMNWQDYFFAPAIVRHAMQLRGRGVAQTYHLHTTVPDSLWMSEFGVELLTACSLVDRVYVHTDEYARRLENQLERLKLRVPEILRYDLGVDHEHMDRGLEEVSKENYSLHPAYQSLSSAQREFVDEVYRTQGVVPHRFIDIDRLDPGKGTATVVRSVKRFLDECAAEMSRDEIERSFRFFFIQDLLTNRSVPGNIKDRYAEYVRALFNELKAAYPSVVYISPSLGVEGRILIPSLLREAHGITGGAEDGLNLAVMESLYVNRDLDTTIIAGSGAGVSMHLTALGIHEHVFIPSAGSVDEFTESLHRITELQRGGNVLQRMKRPVVDHLLTRRDSVIVTL